MDALRRYQPLKTDNGDGTFSEVLDEETAITIFGWIKVHAAEVTLITNKHEDVFPGAILVVLDDERAASYRVLGSEGVPSSGYRSHTLERIAKPITQPAGSHNEAYSPAYD